MGKNLHPINSASSNKKTEFTLTRLPPPPFLAPLLSRDHLPRHHFLKVLKKVLCSHAMTWKEGHFWSIDLTNVNWTTLGQNRLGQNILPAGRAFPILQPGPWRICPLT